MMRASLLALLMAILWSVPAEASEYMCRHISVDHGLSQSNVTSLVRDRRGFLWIGSKFGLNRYDFATVTNIYSDSTDASTIQDNAVAELYVDSRDTLWVAGERGLAYYRRHTDDFRRVDSDGKGLNVRSFIDEGSGLLLGGGGSLYFFDYATDKATRLQTKGGSPHFYTAIHYWKPDVYILATRWDGLWLFDRRSATISRLPDCPEQRIMASSVDKDGNLWVAAYGEGVFCYGRDGTRRHVLRASSGALSSDIVLDIVEKDGLIWLATDGAGICIYDPSSGQILHEPDGVLDALGAVTRLFVDRHGDVYAGTVHDGAVTIRSVAIRTFQNGSVPWQRLSAVSALFHDTVGRRLWVGSDGQGLHVHTEGSSEFRPVEVTAGKKVVSIADFDSRSLIVSTFDSGLLRLDKSTAAPLPVPAPLMEAYERNKPARITMHLESLSNGSLAILTDRVSVFDPATGTLHEPDKAHAGGLTPFYRSPGTILFHSDTSVGEYDALTGGSRTLHSQKQRITCAAYDGDRTIYIGAGNGVTALDITDGSVRPVADIPSGYISILAVDNHLLWMGTNNALLAMDMTDGATYQFGRFDGVGANEYMPTATLATDRYLYMGGVNGLLRVDRQEVGGYLSADDGQVLSVANLEIDGVPAFADLLADGSITISHSHRNIRMSIVTDGRSAAPTPRYMFVVRGPDGEQCIETFSNTINLGSLAPGHTYDISAAPVSPDGSWGEPQRLMKMAVTAPWYYSGWIWIAVLMLGAAGMLIAEARRRRIRRHNMNMQLEAVRHSALEKEVAFLVNTNYALRNPLTMIYAPVKMIIERLGKGEDVDVEGELQNVYRNTKRMRDVIDMAMELHKVGTLPQESTHVRRNMREAVADAIALHSDAITNKHIDARIDAPSSLPDIMLSAPEGMRVVLDILMHNAVRRSAENSSLRICLSMTDPTTMRISFADHGPTPDDPDMASLFSYSNSVDSNSSGIVLGLAYARSIADTLGGHIGADINPAPEGGITVWIELPVELACEPSHKPRACPAAPAPAAGKKAPIVDVDTSELTVVVVEDDTDLCMFVAGQLRRHFKRVLHAFNGKDALDIIRREQPDIVVSSFLLPFKSGIELCLDIKSNADTRHIPVILLTTLKEGPHLESAYAAGADSYLSKPFDMNVLMMRMRNLLHSRHVMKQRYSRPPADTGGAPAADTGLSNADETLVMKVDSIIAENIENPDFNVEAIARAMFMSRSVLYTKFKTITGSTLAAYINDYRLRRACSLLLDTSLTVSEISEKLGFTTQRYFSTFFKERTGSTPTQYRNEHS